METDLIELFETVKKSADAAASIDNTPEEDRCVDALRLLKKFPVDYQILVSTQVGKRLRQLTKHPRKKIQSLASELIEIWKGIIVEETLKNKKNGNLEIKESPRSEHGSSHGSSHGSQMSEKKFQRNNSVNSVKVEKTGGIKVEKNGHSNTTEGMKADKNGHSKTPSAEQKINAVKVEKKPTTNDVTPPKLTSLVSCKDPVRDKIRELVAEALCKVSGEINEELRDKATACDPYRIAVSVESAMYEKWGKSNGTQKFKYRSIMFNVKDPKNPDFRRKILLGHLKPERILELTPEEMASDERQKQNVKIKEKALFDCERGGPPKATTDQFRCGRCGKRKCTYYQLQTRSADEPMTTFVTCVNCDNHWKFC